jgi:hypothetical protein
VGARGRDAPHREPGPFAHREDDARGRADIFDPGLVNVRGQEALVAVIPFEQLGDHNRIGEQLTLEVLLVDDGIEIVGVDARRAIESQHHPVVLRTGLHMERDAAAIRRHLLEPVLHPGLEIAVGHQPFPQRLRAIVCALLVEHAALPLGAHLRLHVSGWSGAVEHDVDLRAAPDVDGQASGILIDLARETDA